MNPLPAPIQDQALDLLVDTRGTLKTDLPLQPVVHPTEPLLSFQTPVLGEAPANPAASRSTRDTRLDRPCDEPLGRPARTKL